MPKIIDKKEKKKKILIAALKVFARSGVAKTKMADIAHAAGIGKGTIYEYYKSKEELFRHTYHFIFNELEYKINQRLKTVEDPIQKLKLVFEMGFSEFVFNSEDVAEIVMEIWAEGVRQKNTTRVTQMNLYKIYLNYRRTFEEILKEGIAKNQLKPHNTTIAASMLIAIMDGLFLQWILDKNVFEFKNTYQDSLNYVLNGLKK